MSGLKRWWVHANNAHPMDKVTFLPVGCVEVVAASDHDAAIAAEREACAKVADDTLEAMCDVNFSEHCNCWRTIAAAIRARGEGK